LVAIPGGEKERGREEEQWDDVLSHQDTCRGDSPRRVPGGKKKRKQMEGEEER